MIRKNPVIYLGLFQTAVNASRTLVKNKIPVLGYDYNTKEPGFYSRLINSETCPHPSTQEDSLISFLIDRINQLDSKPFIIPATDEYLYFLNKNRAEFENISYLLLPSGQAIDILLDKKCQFESAGRVGLNVPPYFEFHSIEELKSEIDSISFPVFVKPRVSFLWKNHFNNKGMLVNDKNDLTKSVKSLLDKNLTFLVQEIIQGDTRNNIEVNILKLSDHTIYISTVRKIRQYPHKFGTATSLCTISHDYLEGKLLQYINEVGITGFSNTEFIYDEKTSKYYFIETNPRIWLQIDLCEYTGDNFLMNAYKHVTGIQYNGRTKNDKEVLWVDPASDLLSLIKQGVDIHGYLSFTKNLIKAKSHGTFYWRDPVPFLRDVQWGLRLFKFMGKNKTKVY